MSPTIRVTVDGPSVSMDVTLGQVRAYLTARGWEQRDDGSGERWRCPNDRSPCYVHPREDADKMRRCVERIASHEAAVDKRDRLLSTVLREIAGVEAEDAPLDLDAIEARAKAATPWSAVHVLLPLREDALVLAAEVRRLRVIAQLVDGHEKAMVQGREEARLWRALRYAEKDRRLPTWTPEGEASTRSIDVLHAALRAFGIDPDAAESTSAPTVRERSEAPTDLERRLIAAWRASGVGLGKLLVFAANEYAFGAAVSMTGLADEAMVSMAERWVRAQGDGKTVAKVEPCEHGVRFPRECEDCPR